MPCATDSLSSPTVCLFSCLPVGTQWAALLNLYCNAVACDPSTLANNARCVQSCIPEGLQLPALISLFQRLINDGQTPAQLANAARCTASCVPAGTQLAVLIDLTCNAMDATFPPCGSLEGDAPPAGAVTPQFIGQLYNRNNGEGFYYSTGLTSADWTLIP